MLHPKRTPCGTCAFTDPEAWVADPAMAAKLQQSLANPETSRFYCHDGLPKEHGDGRYLPPLREDGSVDADALTPCTGFLRFLVKHVSETPDAQRWEIYRMQIRMCKRYLKSDNEHAQAFRQRGIDAAMLAEGLNLVGETHGDA